MHMRRVTLIRVHNAPQQVVLQKSFSKRMSRANCWKTCRTRLMQRERSGFKSTASVDRPCPNCVEPRLTRHPRFWATASRIFSPPPQPQTEGYSAHAQPDHNHSRSFQCRRADRRTDPLLSRRAIALTPSLKKYTPRVAHAHERCNVVAIRP